MIQRGMGCGSPVPKAIGRPATRPAASWRMRPCWLRCPIRLLSMIDLAKRSCCGVGVSSAAATAAAFLFSIHRRPVTYGYYDREQQTRARWRATNKGKGKARTQGRATDRDLEQQTRF